MVAAAAVAQEIQGFHGYYAPLWKKVLFYLLGFLTLGASLLVAKWSPKAHIWLSLSPCGLASAQYILVKVRMGPHATPCHAEGHASDMPATQSLSQGTCSVHGHACLWWVLVH